MKLLIILAALLLASCTSTLPRQTADPGADTCTVRPDGRDTCAGRYYREYGDDSYDLAFVEFSERGNVFDNQHLKTVLRKVETKANTDGVITVVFIHGWLNNAREDNSNLKKFRTVLQSLADGTRHQTSNRKVVGLFVGWRGESIPVWGARMFSFWNRKSVAQNLGSGGITQLLLELDRINQIERSGGISNENIMITVGHSFGGAIVLTAVKDVLLDRLISTKPDGRTVTGIGDEVVLLNPAIEANQLLTLVDVAANREYPGDQSTIMTVISSDQDLATHWAFPGGQLFGTLLLRTQEDLKRDWYTNRNTNAGMRLREEDLDGITIGNFAPFHTHRIDLESTDGRNNGCTTYRATNCVAAPEACRSIGWNRTRPEEQIKQIPANYPLRMVKTDKTIINGHSDIFSPSVSILLRGLIENRLLEQPWENSASRWATAACSAVFVPR